MKVTQTVNLFTPQECREIVRMGEALPQADWHYEKKDHPGTVALKKSGAAIPINYDSIWIINKVIPLLDAWPIKKMEALQYGVYELGAWMDWHLDKGSEEADYSLAANMEHMKDRLCGGILMLTDPQEYEGGELQILEESGEYIPALKDQGSLVVMGSDVLHRVTEVTKGTRRTVISWGMK